MYIDNDAIVYSPSDLCRYMSSPFASWMDRYSLDNPDNQYKRDETESFLGMLQDKGDAHEAALLDKFKPRMTRIKRIVPIIFSHIKLAKKL